MRDAAKFRQESDQVQKYGPAVDFYSNASHIPFMGLPCIFASRFATNSYFNMQGIFLKYFEIALKHPSNHDWRGFTMICSSIPGSVPGSKSPLMS